MSARVITFVAGGVAAVSAIAIAKALEARRIPQLQPNSPGVQSARKQLNHKYHPFFATGGTIFSFGPRSTFSFVCELPSFEELDTTTSRPRFLWQAYISRETLAHDHLSSKPITPYYHAFTPHEDEYMAYMDHDMGKPVWKFVLNSSRHTQAPAYSSLTRWLVDQGSPTESSLRQTILVFGPGASYFARTADSCTWHDLPQTLEKIILEKKALCNSNDNEINGDVSETNSVDKLAWIPRIVALGARGSYVGIWEDGRCAFSLQNSNDLASQFSDNKSVSTAAAKYENIVLNPHDADRYFCATKGGMLTWSVDSSIQKDAVSDMAVAAGRHMQARVRTNGQILKMSRTVGGKTVDYTISPNTDWTQESLSQLLTLSRWQRLWKWLEQTWK